MKLNKIKTTIKHTIYRYVKYELLNKYDKNQYEDLKNKKKIFIMQTPLHSNLGDHAIVCAEKEFIINNLPEYQMIEIPYSDVYNKAKEIKNIVNKNDFIFIHGGGNMGDMYDYEEYVRRFIIKYFDNTNIISFPQTISFSDTFYGKVQLKLSKKVYKKNDNLLLVAREKKSYEIMKKEFSKTNIILTPDIVLSLDKRNTLKRDGILVCLRNDIEGVLNTEFKKELISEIEDKFNKVTITDTITPYNINESQRDNELKKIWDEFSKSEVVLTDRLHGMIFAAITATPCVVLGNSNHKIEESYNNWLKDIEYITFIKESNEDKIIKEIERLKSTDFTSSDFKDLDNKYDELIQYISNIVVGEHHE